VRKRRTQLNRAVENLLIKLDMQMETHRIALHDLEAVREYLVGSLEYEPDDAPVLDDEQPVDEMIVGGPQWKT